MRVSVVCHGTVLLPALQALASQGLLAGVAVPDRLPEIHAGLEQAARQAAIPFACISPDTLEEQLSGWLEESKPDVVCAMGFPCRIPSSLLGRPRFGFFNLHGGALPRYRGPDPVFWQIRNREPNGAITIHRMTPDLDAGGIAHAEPVPIGPEDTYGLHLQRIGALLPRVLIEFLQKLDIHGDALPLVEQGASEARYWKRPADADLAVDWSAGTDAIKALVRACNPLYAGALALLKGVPVRLLQVTAGGAYGAREVEPGLIVEADRERGIRVACGRGETLFLDIVYAEDGFFTGGQLVNIFGLGPGDGLR